MYWVMKSRRMGKSVYGMNGGKLRNLHKIVVGKLERKEATCEV
jgi:hypothetical protein